MNEHLALPNEIVTWKNKLKSPRLSYKQTTAIMKKG
jgi:hypothetical protein